MDWKALAQQAIKNGYQRGNPWERQFHLYLIRNQPELVKEFQKDRLLGSYIIVKTNDAMNRANQLEQQGTPSLTAQELALAELLEAPPEATTQWEQEGAEQDIMAAVAKHLESLSQNTLSPKAPPT